MHWKSMVHVLFHIYNEVNSTGAHVLKCEALCLFQNPEIAALLVFAMCVREWESRTRMWVEIGLTDRFINYINIWRLHSSDCCICLNSVLFFLLHFKKILFKWSIYTNKPRYLQCTVWWSSQIDTTMLPIHKLRNGAFPTPQKVVSYLLAIQLK
jgi:hypothetical protein